MASTRVLAFAGSIRKESFNRKLLVNSQALAPEGMDIEIFDIDEIPVYNMDLEPDFPAAVVALKAKIKAADGVLIAVPEHNFSFSGVLKNVLDWISRPASDGILEGKPVIVQSASPSWAGGLRAQIQLRQVLAYFPVRQMYFPEVCVGQCRQKFDESGKLTDALALENITKQLASFKEFIGN
jgi:chromate reductase, NAD(P)H dehydrogenase (quinone)